MRSVSLSLSWRLSTTLSRESFQPFIMRFCTDSAFSFGVSDVLAWIWRICAFSAVCWSWLLLIGGGSAVGGARG